jgi:hypothetical protein
LPTFSFWASSINQIQALIGWLRNCLRRLWRFWISRCEDLLIYWVLLMRTISVDLPFLIALLSIVPCVFFSCKWSVNFLKLSDQIIVLKSKFYEFQFTKSFNPKRNLIQNSLNNYPQFSLHRAFLIVRMNCEMVNCTWFE